MAEYFVDLDRGVKLPDQATDPISGLVAGLFYYNTTSNVFRGYNGTSWDTIPFASSTGATFQSTPSDPATTTTAGVMMGLAGSITPTKSGTVMIVISGDWDNATNNNGCEVQMRTGTGTAPVNGSALTGTVRGALIKFLNNNSNQRAGWSVNCVISGLTLATAYWIDIELGVVTGGTARVRDISISAIEL